ncbi:MAG: YceI family protein [Caulobacteraceae bacterium]
MRHLVALTAALILAAAFPAASAVSRDPAQMPAGTWQLDRSHSTVTARVMHMERSWYVVRFDVVDATLTYDARNPEASRLSASVDATSFDVNADYGRRFADQFLDATKSPRMTFVSTQLTRTGPSTGTMTGNLTLHGVTKPVTFNVVFNGAGAGMLPLTNTAGFSATATIKRSDFGSTFLQNLVGDDVIITVETEFTKR